MFTSYGWRNISPALRLRGKQIKGISKKYATKKLKFSKKDCMILKKNPELVIFIFKMAEKQHFSKHKSKETDRREKLKEPLSYNVILHNDNFTTMEFVVQVLTTVFNLNVSEATAVMLRVHENGKGVAGRYCKDIAITKKDTVETMAGQAEFPLKCTVEPVK